MKESTMPTPQTKPQNTTDQKTTPKPGFPENRVLKEGELPKG